MSESIRATCLIEELETAHNLIECGFGELQEMRMGNDFYHLPQQLLASGFERLMKCYFCLVYEARNGQYPETRFLERLGHDLEKMKRTLATDYFATNGIPLLCDDLDFLKNDLLLERIIHILSGFGKKARYYNLDIVTGSQKPPIDPKAEWEALETDVEDPSPYLSLDSMEALHRDYYPRVNAIIIAKLERLFRAIAMQFTLGRHGGKLQQLSPTIATFITLKNEDFGTRDYRRSVKESRQSKDKWSKRSKADVSNSRWPSALISKEQFEGDWPFRFEEVVIECRENLFCIINIEGYDFALNGAANSRFGYPFPHDAGIAILGKSIGPFIDMAFSLSPTSNAGGSSLPTSGLEGGH